MYLGNIYLISSFLPTVTSSTLAVLSAIKHAKQATFMAVDEAMQKPAQCTYMAAAEFVQVLIYYSIVPSECNASPVCNQPKLTKRASADSSSRFCAA